MEEGKIEQPKFSVNFNFGENSLIEVYGISSERCDYLRDKTEKASIQAITEYEGDEMSIIEARVIQLSIAECNSLEEVAMVIRNTAKATERYQQVNKDPVKELMSMLKRM